MSNATLRNLGISAFFLLIAMGVFGYGLVLIEGQNSQLTEQITTLEKNQAQEASYRQMRRTAEEPAGNREILNTAFLSGEGESIDFLTTVESLARDSGLEITTDELRKNTTKDSKDEWLTIGFTYSGQYDTVVNFLEVLENLPYLAEITSFSLVESTGDVGWEATVTMKVYIYSYEN